jgi:acyl-CoA thioesterase-1
MAHGVKQLRTKAAWLALAGALFLQTADAAKRDPSDVITIVALGDSLTAGYGLSRKQAYPALIGEKMREAGYEFEVVNAGSSGDTTRGGLQRLPAILRAHKKIDVFVLELGINDAFRGVPIDQIRANLQTIIDRVRAHDPRTVIIIAGMQLPDYTSDDYVGAFGRIFAALAEKNRAVLLPYLLEGVGGDPALNQWDRVHPNAAGQRILAENVWRVLEPVLKQLSSRARVAPAVPTGA